MVIVHAGSYEEEILELSQSLSSNIEKAKKHTVAVVDFTDLQGNITGLGRFIAEELSSNLVNVKKGFVVIDRIHLKHIIKEHKLSVSAFFDPKAVENFGKISGVDAIIIGAVTPFGDSVSYKTVWSNIGYCNLLPKPTTLATPITVKRRGTKNSIGKPGL